MKAHIITIGDELLIGQVVDTNSAWMAQQLNLNGIQITGITSVSDSHNAIVEAIQRIEQHTDLILTTGGLGPTKDDITKLALADHFETELVFHEPTFKRIETYFKKRGLKVTESIRIQCQLPANCFILPNDYGSAPGMWFERNGKVLISMPGVPEEMKHLITDRILPRLTTNFPGSPIAHRTIRTVGMGESAIAERISTFEAQLPPHIQLAYLPNLGSVRLRLTARGPDEAVLHEQLTTQVNELKSLIPELIYGYDEDELEMVVGQMLQEQGKTLGTAESCTGGYIAHRITTIAGSSAYFKGSIVAYANTVKMQQLGVQERTLSEHGAVSEATVREMVAGALQNLKVDYAIAVSGIAGPTGGTPDKPVGTIWIAVGDKDNIQTRRFNFVRDRMRNITFTSVVALNMLRKFLLAT